jgi:predicted MFS family arabinose efflux permease
VLLLTNVLNLADRQGIAVVGQAIKLDLTLSDRQLGLVQGLAFAIFYSLLALPIARLAEHRSRTRIIAGSVALFGITVALCSRVHSFWQLLACRIGVGIGDAGLGPPAASLVGDHYRAERRASAMSILWLGAPIGVVLGSSLGGWIAEHANWRWAFVAIGTPALIVAILAAVTLREPPRGMSDPAASSPEAPPPMWTVLRFLLGKPSVLHVLVGAGLAAISMHGIGQWMAPFLIRNYHLGFAQTGRVMALIAGAAMASGLALGGFGVDWVGRFDRRWYSWGPAAGLALATPAFLVGFSQGSIALAVVLLMAAHVALFVYWTPTIATAQNMVGASMRASSYFVVSIFLNLVGIGLGPTVAGWLSDVYARSAFTLGDYAVACPGGHAAAEAAQSLVQSCAQASATGLRYALMTMSLTFVWAGLHYFLAARNLRRDLEIRYEPSAA